MTTQLNSENEQKQMNTCRCSGSFRPLSLLTFLIAVGGLSLAGYNFFKSEHVVRQQFSETRSNIEKNQSDTKSLLQTVENLKSDEQKQNELMQNLTRGLEQLAATKPLKHQEWVLREVDYLVQTAAANLQFSRDVDGTIALLSVADQRLQGLVDPDAQAIRQSLNDNITALKVLPRFDRGGLLARIQALSNQAIALPLRSPISEGKAVVDNTPAATPLWRNAIHNSLHALQKMVVVRHLDQNISPMLAPQDQALLSRNIQYICEQAQWAAIRHDEKLFQQSLAQVRQIVTQYYVSEADSTLAVLKELEELAKLNIAPTLPDFSATQQKLAAILTKEATSSVNH